MLAVAPAGVQTGPLSMRECGRPDLSFEALHLQILPLGADARLERPSAPMPPCTFSRRVTSIVAVWPILRFGTCANANAQSVADVAGAATVGPPCAPVLMSRLSTPSARRVQYEDIGSTLT